MKSANKTAQGDKQLLRHVKRARRGDNAAFDALIQIKGQDILYTCISLMKNRQDGEDVAQEVVLRLKKEIVKLEKPAAFGGWMYRVIYTTCMNAKKRNNRLPDLDEQAIINAPLEEEREEFLPQKYAETEESRARLLEAINDLPDKQRACILFFYYSDMSYMEIAESLETNEQDVANCLNRAKKRLKATLEPGEDEKLMGSMPLPAKGAGVLGAASVITMALEQQAEALVSPQMIGVLEIAATAIAVGGSAAAGASSAGAANIFGGLSSIPAKVAAVATSVAVVGGAGAATYNVVSNDLLDPLPAYEETLEEDVLPPAADPVSMEESQEVTTTYAISFVAPETYDENQDIALQEITGVELTKDNFPQEGLLEVMGEYDLNNDGYLDLDEMASFPGQVSVTTQKK